MDRCRLHHSILQCHRTLLSVKGAMIFRTKEKEKLLNASRIEALRVRRPPISLDLSHLPYLLGSS
jgi:hypothetical protein